MKFYKKKKIGCLLRDKQQGPLVDEWEATISDHEKVDISPAISTVLSVKDAQELVNSLFKHLPKKILTPLSCRTIAESCGNGSISFFNSVKKIPGTKNGENH